MEKNKESPQKPKFDKKKWRQNKYNHKVKVDKWKENREKKIQRKYFQMLNKEANSKNANLVPLGKRSEKLKTSFKLTKMEFERRRKKAEKKHLRDEKEKKILERKEAIKAYKQKKAEKFKILSKKNKKGQPIMAGRMELLLEKIKQQTN